MRNLFVILIFTYAFPVLAQEQSSRSNSSEYVRMPINISIYKDYSLGHTIGGGRKINNHLSLNIIRGNAAKLRGIEVGGCANVTGGGFGIQAAGLANVNQNNYMGIMATGLANVVKGDTFGIQAGGLANVIQGEAFGIQFS